MRGGEEEKRQRSGMVSQGGCARCGADSESVKVLRDRIQCDKRKLRTIESRMRRHDTSALLSSRKNATQPGPMGCMDDCTVVRDNPIFHDNTYDAMDAYIHDESLNVTHSKKGHRDIKILYRECQRRIQAAESLLEKASAEVRPYHDLTLLFVCIFKPKLDYFETYN